MSAPRHPGPTDAYLAAFARRSAQIRAQIEAEEFIAREFGEDYQRGEWI